MAKKWPKKGVFWGFSWGGSKKGHFGGGGLSPRGGQKIGGFCLSNLHSFWPKRQIWSKRAIFWNFGHFGGFWGFWGCFNGGPKSGHANGQKWGFLGFSGGGRKRGLIKTTPIPRTFPQRRKELNFSAISFHMTFVMLFFQKNIKNLILYESIEIFIECIL